MSFKESLFLYNNKTQRLQQRLCIQNMVGDTASLTDRFLTRDETGKSGGQGELCAEEDGEGQVDLLGPGLQDPAPVISLLAVRCCPVLPITLQTWRTVPFVCPKLQEGDPSWPCDDTLNLTLMSLQSVWMFTVPPLTSLCHSPWACGLLVISVSFSLKRQQWP